MSFRGIVLSIFSLACILLLTSVVEGQLYGDACEPGGADNCTLNLFLKCNNDTKKCGCQVGTHLDAGRNPWTCVAKANETCNLYPEDGTLPMLCTPNSRCLPDTNGVNKCYCERHFIQDNGGHCIRSGLHGESCSIPEECRLGSFLECLDQICVCDAKNGSYVWDPLEKACVSLIGVECAPHGPYSRTCIDKSTCVNGICTCNGYEASLDKKRCVRGYDGVCDSSDDCADGLECDLIPSPSPSPPTTTPTSTVASSPAPSSPAPPTSPAEILAQGKCGCTAEETYNNRTSQCDILVDKPCYSNSTKTCVGNAQCLNNICKCTSQYLPENGICVGNYGASCGSGADCSARNFLTCNSVDNLCECNENYEFNSNISKCIAPIESPCLDNGNCDPISSTCESNTCKCASGFVRSLNQSLVSTKCFVTHNGSCSQGSCDTFRFLECSSSQICTCLRPQDQSFNSTLDKCLAHALTPCKLVDGEEMSCVENAICDTKSSDSAICTCAENFHVERGFCEKNSATSLQTFSLPLIALVALVFKNSM